MIQLKEKKESRCERASERESERASERERERERERARERERERERDIEGYMCVHTYMHENICRETDRLREIEGDGHDKMSDGRWFTSFLPSASYTYITRTTHRKDSKHNHRPSFESK